MRKPPYLNQIETSFAVPAEAPPDVEAAWLKFDRLAVEYEDARQALKSGPRALDAAKQNDRAANGADYAAGRTPKDPLQHEQAAEKTLQALKAKVEGLLSAIDTAGDNLLETIDAVHDDWIDTARSTLAADLADYIAHVKAARSAAQRLATSRGVVRWLDGWRLVRGGGGIIVNDLASRYTGRGSVSVDTANIRRYEQVAVVELLDLLASVTTDATTPQTRKSVTVR